jgi:hypothetical protein
VAQVQRGGRVRAARGQDGSSGFNGIGIVTGTISSSSWCFRHGIRGTARDLVARAAAARRR